MIDEKLIDVQHHFTGMLESETDKTYGQEFKASWEIPRDLWRPKIEDIKATNAGMCRYNLKINNQNPESSCVCNAAETCFRSVWTRQLGVKYSIDFSPMALYYLIMGGCGSGSSMADALDKSKDVGFIPEDNAKNKLLFKHVYHQNTPCKGRKDLPSGWEITARHFRPLEWHRIATREQFASALLQGWPICYGRSGHSIAAMELVFENNKFLAKYACSYGTQTGDGGYRYDSESNMATGGAWCCRATTIPDDPKFPAGDDTIKSAA